MWLAVKPVLAAWSRNLARASPPLGANAAVLVMNCCACQTGTAQTAPTMVTLTAHRPHRGMDLCASHRIACAVSPPTTRATAGKYWIQYREFERSPNGRWG